MKSLPTIIVESIIVAENMERFGGGFIQNIGRALMHADVGNAKKIHDTWPAEWAHYLNINCPSTTTSATKGENND